MKTILLILTMGLIFLKLGLAQSEDTIVAGGIVTDLERSLVNLKSLDEEDSKVEEGNFDKQKTNWCSGVAGLVLRSIEGPEVIINTMRKIGKDYDNYCSAHENYGKTNKNISKMAEKQRETLLEIEPTRSIASDDEKLECHHLVETPVDKNDTVGTALAIAPQGATRARPKLDLSGVRVAPTPPTPPTPPTYTVTLVQNASDGENDLLSAGADETKWGAEDVGDKVLIPAFDCAKKALGLRIIYDKLSKASEVETDDDSKCDSHGSITKDYEDCKELWSLAKNFYYGRQTMGVTQGVDQQKKHAELQSQVFQDHQLKASGTTELQALKGSIDKNTQHQYQKATLSAAEAAALKAKINAFPTRQKAKDFCIDDDNDDAIIGAVKELGGGSFSRWTPPASNPEDTPCALALQQWPQLFANEDVLNEVKGMMFQAGVRAATELGQAKLMEGQARDVQENIEALKKRDEDDKASGGFDPDMLVDTCVVNPHLPICQQQVGQERGALAHGFNFQGSQGSASLTRADKGQGAFKRVAPDRGLNLGGSGPLPRTNELEEKLGRSVRGQSPGGGKRPSLAGGSGGGGGGGGGVGSGGGGSSSGGVSPRDFKGRSRGRSPNGNVYSSAGVRRGRLFAGGSKAKASKKNSKLADLFNKKKKIRDSILNYRLPASVTGKDGNIFQRISARYDQVESAKRLLEYEVK